MQISNKQQNIFVLPDFLEIQINSFILLLNKCILEELNNFPILKDKNEEIEFKFISNQYRLSEPLFSEREAVYYSNTYASEIYVPIQLTNIKTGKYKIQIVSLGSIPLMTHRGTFIINGICWTTINQVIRNPGIYCTLNRDNIYTATILCIDTDKRIRIEMDKKERFWIRLQNRYKIPMISLLIALGMDISLIPNWLKSRTKDLDNILNDSEYQQQQEFKLIYNQLPGPKPRLNTSMVSAQIQQIFYDTYRIGLTGRINLNERLCLNINKKHQYVTTQDLIGTAYCLLKITKNFESLDEIDHLKNKCINSVANLIKKQLKTSLLDLQLQIKRTIRKINHDRIPSPRNLLISRPFTSSFNQFFGTHELIQFLDQTNPLAEIAHKRKLSFLGPGGLTRRTASFKTRDIHPSHYGRICPIETSEGMNAGLISALTVCAKVDEDGTIKNPLYKVYTTCLSEHTIYISAKNDEKIKIAINNRLAVGHFLQERETSVQYQQEFINNSWNSIDLRSVLPIQYFSIGACLIPFLEHNDANRALMGSNMQRQAVPLLHTEKPIVGTGLEAQIALDSSSVLIALEKGIVTYIDKTNITLLTNNNTYLSQILLNYEKSNNGTCINHNPIVKKYDVIKKGQILADGAGTCQGELALGKNLLVAYMPWEGFNFEDAVLINERLVHEDIFTSIHIQKYETSIQDTNEKLDTITKDIPHLDKFLLRHLDDNGIVSLGSMVEPGDVLVGKISPLESEQHPSSPEGKLLQAIFGIQAISTRENCLKLPTGGKGIVIDIRWITHNNGLLDSVHIYVLQKRRIQVGDKIAGRHGNKGIISMILPRQDMPYLQDGTPIDMVLSPLGVPSRMNVGQLYECLLGLAGFFLKTHYRILPFDERYEQGASRKLVFSELYNSREKCGLPWIFEPNHPGKSLLFDGRTGEIFEQPITVGRAYIMKLIHQVDDKIHARSSGPYAVVTQQPLRGRSNRGGQRVGEMEVWALEGFGAAYTLKEMLTIKSDHSFARNKIISSIVGKENLPRPKSPPDSLRLLIRELRCLGMDIEHMSISDRNLKLDFRLL